MNSPVPYEIRVQVNFLNVEKDTEYVKIKLYSLNQTKSNVIFSIDPVWSMGNRGISKDSEIIIKNDERNLDGFRLVLVPYRGIPEEIGKEQGYRLEVYKNSTLFLEKTIRIQAEHMYPEGHCLRDDWLLKASKFEVESMDYVKKIEDFRPFILIEK